MSRDIGKTPAVHSISETCSGSLQEKNGVWYTVISYKQDGNRKNKWETTHLSGRKNKKTADILLQERMEEFNRLATQKNDETFHHIRVIPRVTLFSDYLELWMQMQEPNVAYNTALSRKQMLKARIRPFFDARKITLASLSAMDVEEFYISLRKANLTGSSMIHYHQLMNQALEAAVKKDLIEKNPMKKVDRPHKNQFVGTFYNREEIDALLNAFINDPLYPMVFVDIYYGLRRGELIGLMWSSIDFEKNTISVEHKVITEYDGGGSAPKLIVTDELKTKNSRRTLPLIPSVREVLLGLLDSKEKNKRMFKDSYCTDYEDMVFVDPVGHLYTPEYVTTHFAVVLKQNNLRKLRFHDLRHTCASLLVAEGVDMFLIQHWLGHANYSTTADVYSHLSSGAQTVTADAIVNALK